MMSVELDLLCMTRAMMMSMMLMMMVHEKLGGLVHACQEGVLSANYCQTDHKRAMLVQESQMDFFEMVVAVFAVVVSEGGSQ